MLSLRHHIDPTPLPHHPSSSSSNTSNSPATATTTPRYLQSTLQRPQSTSGTHHTINTSGTHMSSAYNFPGPAIRVQQSTPTPQPLAQFSSQEQGFPTHTANWLYGEGDAQSASSLASQAANFGRRGRGHQRATSSSSSVDSNSPASAFGHAGANQFSNNTNSGRLQALRNVDPSPFPADESSRMYPNHLPTPTQTPTRDSFLASSNPSSFAHFANLDSTMASHMAMKQAFADDDDAPGFSHSTRHSVSSFGRNSPATPRTVSGEDFDEGFKLPSTDLAVRPVHQVPKLERTLTDVYSDELFNPTSVPSSTPKKNYSTLLSPYHNVMMSERLQQADQARSHSPTANGARGVSPFRQGSPYAQAINTFASPQGRLNAGVQLRQKQKSDAEAAALSQQSMSGQDSQPKTISPKDALLDYHEADEDAKMPLFSDVDDTQFNAYAGNFQESMPTKADTSFGSLTAGPAVNGWANAPGANAATSYSAASTSAAPQAQFTFTPSSVPGMFHGLPTTTYGSTALVAPTEDTPEFPARLTSMESSASEAPPQSSQNSTGTEPLRPASTLAETGTYTCTYHGCTQRFETPQKLQRHKREAHRQNNSATPAQSTPPAQAMGSGMTSAALAARNSQAGPHKCERINPTTGKPCNTVFSRPYDLTRHEDTIHNARKQKVRCALCQEEKTFSRNDALTRHMRVVHPEVDFPGKHRKRGGRDDD